MFTLKKKQELTFGPGFRFGDANFFHKLKGEGDVVDLLLEVPGSQMEAVERNEEAFQEAHEKSEVNAIMELRFKFAHFEVYLVQVFVNECDQRLKKQYRPVACTIGRCMRLTLFGHSSVCLTRLLQYRGPVLSQLDEMERRALLNNLSH